MYNSIFFYQGFLAILAQLVIFRELAVLFYGNELFWGAFMASWLFWVGLGSSLTSRFIKKGREPEKYLSWGFLALALLLPAAVLFIRLSKSFFAFGEFTGPIGTVLFVFFLTSILCFVTGGQFSLACAVISGRACRQAVLERVYLWEAMGATAGGVMFSYALIGFMPVFVIVSILSLFSILVGCYLLREKMSFKGVLLIAAVLCAFSLIFKIEPLVNRKEWSGYQFIRQKENRNATLSLVRMGSIKNIFIDGALAASFPSPENYEPLAHFSLLAAENPAKLLVLGEQSLGAIKEVIKHNPGSVDYVMLDNAFLKLIEPYLEAEDKAVLKDKRINIHFCDERVFIKQARSKYDVVIINISEVTNLKLNRFYTREFFTLIKSLLSSNGILALNVVSSENYLSGQTRMFNASVYRTLESVFKVIEIIPGDNAIFLCGNLPIDMSGETILKRFVDRKILTRYLVPSFIKDKLATNRGWELKEVLRRTKNVRINHDFRPTTCYYFSGFWLDKFVSAPGYLLAGALVVFIVLVALRKKKFLLSLRGRKEIIPVFTLGFVSILLEVVLLLGFQIISGYVYWQIGSLFASFMFGLFLGAALGAKSRGSPRKKHFSFLVLLFLVIVFLSLSAAYFLPFMVALSSWKNLIIFLSFFTLSGITVGASFVIAGFWSKEFGVMAKAGSLYAADLWGSALGALLSTNLIVFVFGIPGALNFAAFCGLIGLTIFLIVTQKSPIFKSELNA